MPKTSAFLLLCLLITSTLVAAKPLVFNRPASSEKSQEIINLLTEAYRRMGVSIEVIDFQHGESLAAANKGILDGQLGRVGNLSARYPNLYPNTIPIAKLRLVLLTKHERCAPTCDLASLKSITYSARYPFSSQYLEKVNYQGVAIDNAKLKVQLSLLDQAKVEGVITLDYLYKEQQKSLTKLDFNIQVLESQPIYHYLHKKHQHLLPLLDKQLIDLCENRC